MVIDKKSFGAQQLEDRLRRFHLEATKELEVFKKRMSEEGPSFAFQWSESAFAAAAMLNVLQSYHSNTEEMDPLEVRLWVGEQCSQKATYARSTSPCANLLAEMESRAWARIYDSLRCLILT